MTTVWHIKVYLDGVSVGLLTDGRDEGGAWFSYDRDVAERHASLLRMGPGPAHGVTYEATKTGRTR